MKDDTLRNDLNLNWKALAPSYFHYADKDYPTEIKDQISEAILKFYFSNEEPPVTEATFQNLTNVFTDTATAYGVREAALTHARHHVPTYAAILSFDGTFSQLVSYGYTKFLGKNTWDS